MGRQADARQDEPGAEYQPAPAEGGDGLVRFCAVVTTLFVVCSVVAVPLAGFRSVLVWIDVAIFLAGCLGFLIGIGIAGNRALEGVSVRASGLFLGAFAEPRDRLVFLVSFVAAIIVGFGVALLVGTGPDSGPYVLDIPATAYGILVPVFPPACAGIHGARYCAWPKSKQ